MGLTLVKILIVEYFLIMISFILQKDYTRALYFLGAIMLNFGILMMK